MRATQIEPRGMPMNPPKLFISYSHSDEAWKDKLVRHLGFLPNRPMAWHDRNISGGDDWEQLIHDAMDQADLAVLMVTADFLSSDFIRTVEVPRLLERYRAGELRLYPVIISRCAWKRMEWLMPLQCRPKDGVPLDTFFEQSSTRGNEQLALIADEIAGLLAGEKTASASTKEDDALRLLSALLKNEGAAEPPQHLQTAIEQGRIEVSATLAAMSDRARNGRLQWQDVEKLTGVAIKHGAGIYNHSDAGRIGCARIYHHAARGFVELMATRGAAYPRRGVDLAADWLRRIVTASPQVSEFEADELAWELRYAFDAIQAIPLCDSIADALAAPKQLPAGLVIDGVLQQCQAMRQDDVAVYVLRHLAEILSSQAIETGSRAHGSARDRVKTILSTHPRVTAGNLTELALILPQALADMIPTLPGDSQPGMDWFNPRSWFRQN